ncbi:MAG TPA: ferredoxin, partial [Firmicutes bacterium]|nr:ferredoxin [Bacillota bacterium]
FSKNITKENIVEMYKILGRELPGKVAVKVHSGEDGNQNYLRPEFMRDIVEYVDGTVVECNTAYDGARNETKKHAELIKKHGWSELFDVDIMDSEEPDLVLDIPNGKVIRENYVGKNMANYDSMLVLSHFKGHPMGGYGGALKQLSIGCASSRGKSWIHSAGMTTDQTKLWDNVAEQDKFLESMADAAKSVVDFFGENIAYINIMCNMSVDCDCCAIAEDPCMPDIGILASTDPVAIDRACIDLVKESTAEGKEHLLERIESRHGTHTIDAAEALGIGSQEYELIELD